MYMYIISACPLALITSHFGVGASLSNHPKVLLLLTQDLPVGEYRTLNTGNLFAFNL